MEPIRALKINIQLLLIKARKHGAVDKLYDEIAPAIRHTALMFAEPAIADELVQEFWANIHDYADRFKSATNGYAYLITIMKNLVSSRKKQLAGDNLHCVPLHYINYKKIPHNSVEDKLILKYSVECAMDKLSDREKQVVQLTVFANLSEREIAEELNIPKSTIHKLKTDGYNKLKIELSDYNKK